MIRSLKDLHRVPAHPPRVAVAAAEESDVLTALDAAARAGLVQPVLFGEPGAIVRAASDAGCDVGGWELVVCADPAAAAREAVRAVSSGHAALLMKGLVDTSVLLHEVLNAEYGLRTDRVLSHAAIFEVPGYPRLLTITDAAMNIAPDLETKRQIVVNAVELLHAVGYTVPVVAALAAKEKVNPKMQATVDAAELVRLNREGALNGCRVGGPFAMDNAISVEAAHTKGITDEAAGRADILLAPTIEVGNVLYKTLAFLMGAESAGLILGARAPIVLTSRADSAAVKLHSIALAAYLSA